MSGVNKVIIIGNLGNDPETRYTPSGGAVTNFSVATSESWTNKETGNKEERTEWHRIVAFNKPAEILGEYLRKGSKVYVEGSLRTRKWQAQDGQDRYTTEIVVDQFEFLTPKPEGAGSPQQNSQRQQQQPARNGGKQSDFQEFDDDIPF